MSNRIKRSTGDHIYFALAYAGLVMVSIFVLYPLLFIVSSSLSSANAITKGKVILLPVELNIESYITVFHNNGILTGYRNTLMYTIVGTFTDVSFTLMCAYPLSRKDMPYRSGIMFLFTFTMFFSGGMIPNYLLMMRLGLINSPAAVILPGLIGVYNMIVARTFMAGVPTELLEASRIDGCSDARYFFDILLPLSKACIAVLALYYAVGIWNAYFEALMYLDDRNLYPLSIFLKEILVSNQMTENMDIDPELLERKQGFSDVIKYALIVITTAPILCLYPFVQKYFVKGVMLGSVKG